MITHELKDILAKTPVGYFKYIRVGNKFRFCHLEESHANLQSDDKAIGAGFLKINEQGIRLEGYSLTLNLGVGPGDEELLSKLLNLPINDHLMGGL